MKTAGDVKGVLSWFGTIVLNTESKRSFTRAKIGLVSISPILVTAGQAKKANDTGTDFMSS